MKRKGLGRGLSALLPDAAEENGYSAGSALVRIDAIRPNPHQPRRDFNVADLESLSNSIREQGIIQPLVVRRVEGRFELVAGERRLRAASMAGLTEVPVRIIEVNGASDLLEMSLVENLQREDLNPVELAEGYRTLHDEWGLTQEEVARRVGRERATVANTIRLLDLPPVALEMLQSGELSTGHAKVILSLPGDARRSALAKRIRDDGLSVRQAEEIAKAFLIGHSPRRSTAPVRESPLVQSSRERIRSLLGTQVHIARRGKKGLIRIEYYSDEDLARIVDIISGSEG